MMLEFLWIWMQWHTDKDLSIEYAPFLILIILNVHVLAEQVLEAPLLSSKPYGRKEIFHVTPSLYLLVNSFAEKV